LVKHKLCELNKKLPAQVYIPFVSKSMRNYAVLNIIAEEAIVFKTKERAPILLTIEVYRPIEMTIDEPNELFNNE
jgi:phosphatidylinositol 4-kinase